MHATMMMVMWMMSSERRQTQRLTWILYGPIYMKCWRQVNSYRYNANWWLSRPSKRKVQRNCLIGIGFSLRVMQLLGNYRDGGYIRNRPVQLSMVNFYNVNFTRIKKKARGRRKAQRLGRLSSVAGRNGPYRRLVVKLVYVGGRNRKDRVYVWKEETWSSRRPAFISNLEPVEMSLCRVPEDGASLGQRRAPQGHPSQMLCVYAGRHRGS